MPEVAWYYAFDGQQRGPVAEPQLIEELARLEVPGEVLVWRSGFTAWIPAESVPEIAAQLRQPSAESGADWFLVSVPKLVVMSLVTLGIYDVYWFWQQWKLVKARTGEDMRPFWRAVFGFFFCYSLFERLKDRALERGLSVPWTPGGLAAAFILLTLTWRLPDPFWLVTYLSVWPLTSFQRTANALCLLETPLANPNRSFSAANWVGILVGSLLFLMVLVGTFLPVEP